MVTLTSLVERQPATLKVKEKRHMQLLLEILKIRFKGQPSQHTFFIRNFNKKISELYNRMNNVILPFITRHFLYFIDI